jgi:hypothetical protein
MKLKNILLWVVCVLMLAGSADAKLKNGAIVINKTTVAPVIDGKADAIWDVVDATWMNYAASGKPADWMDCSGWCKLMYDDTKIYGLFYVQDNVVDTISSIDWQMDGVEFYIDANNTHVASAQLAAPKFQFNLRPRQPIDSVTKAINHGLKYKWLLDTASINNGGPSGYYVEFSYRLDSLGFTLPVPAGKKVSLQLQIDDNDNDGNGRIHVLNWNASPSNLDYLQTLEWGNAIFSGETFGPQYVFLKTTKAPVIDGNLDAIWNEANQLTMNYVQPQNGMDPQDQSWRFYGLYDDKNIYGYFTVYDNVVDTISSIDWQMDGTEFYIDVNNTHTSTAQLSAPKFQFNLRPCQKIDSVMKAIGHGLQYKWKLLPNKANDSVFSSMTGWAMEFKFSLDSLGFTTPAQAGKQFSFQVQTDDNDNDGSGRIHTSNFWYSPLNQDYLQTLTWGDAKLGPTITTAVSRNTSSVVTDYRLEQNYPNPFNPSTSFSYAIAKAGMVKLTVYNLLGAEVATVVNEVQQAGTYTERFNAGNLSSGVYFYKLQAGDALLVKKMMLLK